MKVCGPAVHGQIGDLVGNTVFCKALKEIFPNINITFAIGNKYGKSEFLFKENKYIDSTHIWDSYDDFPSQKDIEFINQKKFDHVFNPKTPHSRQDWYNFYHYCQEWTLMHGVPTASDLSPFLNPWYHKPERKKIITFSTTPSTDLTTQKTLNKKDWEEIFLFVKKNGYTPVEIGGKFSEKFDNCEQPDFTLIEACKTLLDSALHVSIDCGIGWIASGYQKNGIGIYTNSQIDMVNPWSHMPINKNADYLHYKDIKNIKIEEIFELILKKIKHSNHV